MMSNFLLAIDPAAKALYWAMFDDCVLGRLQAVGCYDEGKYYHKPWLPGHCNKLTRVEIEKPQIYRSKNQKGDPNDLIDVAIMVGRACEKLFLQGVYPHLIAPHTWKGSRPKKIDNEYTMSLLASDERRLVDALKLPASLKHNVIDAVGIGLWALNRR